MEDILPIELIEYIHKFNRQPQSKELQEDIVNFHETRNTIIKQYNGDRDLVINDIIGYLNDFLPILYYGYIDTFRNRVNDIDTFMNRVLYEFNENQAINTLLGILKPPERLHFIEINID